MLMTKAVPPPSVKGRKRPDEQGERMASTEAITLNAPRASTEKTSTRALERRDEFFFVLLGAWITLGVYVDGWAHSNLTTPESFFTPWHGLLYSGIAAANGWVAFLVWRNLRRGLRGLQAIPERYELTVVGAALFPFAGLADLLWHTAFGIEVGIGALLSPSHLLLFSAGLLMFTGPIRSAWSRRELAIDPTFSQIFPALLAVTLVTAAVGFFLHYLSAFTTDIPTTTAEPAGDNLDDPRYNLIVAGIGSVLVTNLLLVGAVLVLLRRLRPPFGSVTFLVSAVVVLATGEHGFEDGTAGLLAAPVGGLAADLLIHRFGRSLDGYRVSRLVAAVFPVALWSSFFAALEIFSGLAWSPELWGGVIFLAGLSGLGLSLLMAPPQPQDEGRRAVLLRSQSPVTPSR
jgi:hypothetical protein